jgi:hypothetical protein
VKPLPDTDLARIATYLTATLRGETPVDLGWVWSLPGYAGLNWLSPPPPPAEELADAFLNDVGFQALRLGTLLNEPDAELLTAVVIRTLPPGQRQATKLIVDALKIAARQQRESSLRRVGAGVLAVAIAAAIWAGLS